MSEIRNRSLRFLQNEDEAPVKKLISDADIFIKQLAEKQSNTSLNLQQELAHPKEFIKATELIPLAQYNSGTSSLAQFEETAKHFDDIEKLKAASLCNKEIEMYFDYLKGEDHLFQKHRNCNTSLLKQRLGDILEKIKNYEKAQSSQRDTPEKLVRSKIVEYGLSTKPISVETKLLNFALANEKEKNKSILPHPMDNIKQIENDCFGYLHEGPAPSINKIRKKARKLANRIEKCTYTNTNINSDSNKNPKINNSLAKNSLWDVTEEVIRNETTERRKTYTCLPQNYYTIRNKEIVKLNKEEVETGNLEVTQKLSIEEIRKLPKFQNYETGIHSNVLYLKNLSNRIKQEHLQRILKQFEKHENITYKIMTGKMKGQAFIYFPDETLAGQALEEINGVVIGGKPIIAQYGKKK